MRAVLKRYTPKAMLISLALIGVFTLAEPTYAATYFHFGINVGSPGWWGPAPGWRWHRSHHWHPGRCGYGPRVCHRAWHRGYHDFWGYWHPGYWTRWCN